MPRPGECLPLTASERKQHQGIDNQELYDVDDHASERNLQRSQVGIDGEEMHELEGGEDVGCRKETFGLRKSHV
jgi:hypothetical protein